MHKIITLFTNKSYEFCHKCLSNDQELQHELRQFAALRTFVLPEKHLDAFAKHVGKTKYTVSDNIRVRLHATDKIPWGVEKVGAPRLWERSKGEGVRVAVIDTGISRRHPDLKGQVKGGVVIAGGGKLTNGHGTHVAGTIAAAMNNYGIVGVAPEAELYDIRVFGADGSAEVADIVAGINWAIENNMHVMNMSFGTSEDSPALRMAIRQAANAGIVMVASAGNNGGAVEYPAAYRNVIAVGATDRAGKLASFSSRGRKVSTLAPGVEINSTWLNQGYKTLDGTSMAAAHVSGLRALELSRRRRTRQAAQQSEADSIPQEVSPVAAKTG